MVEAREGKSPPELIAPSIRSILYSVNAVGGPEDYARRGLRELKIFPSGLKVSFADNDFGLSLDARAGPADSDHIEADLPDLLATVAEAANAAKKPGAPLMGGLHHINKNEFFS